MTRHIKARTVALHFLLCLFWISAAWQRGATFFGGVSVLLLLLNLDLLREAVTAKGDAPP